MLDATLRRLNFLPKIVVADLGYLDQELKAQVRNHFQVALVTKAKSNMLIPSPCDPDGCPCCHQGQRLAWKGYVRESKPHLYQPPAEGEICALCPEQGACEKRFHFRPEEHETFFGLIPLHTRLAQQLLKRIRPLVEPGFDADKNRFSLSGFFINSLELARTLSYLADACNILLQTAQVRTHHGRRYHEADRSLRRQLPLDFGS